MGGNLEKKSGGAPHNCEPPPEEGVKEPFSLNPQFWGGFKIGGPPFKRGDIYPPKCEKFPRGKEGEEFYPQREL